MCLPMKNIARSALRRLARAAFLVLFLPFCTASAQGSFEQSAINARFSGTLKETRIEIDFDKRPDVTPSLLASPYRLILDMPETLFALGGESVPEKGLIDSYRHGLMQAGRSRMILAMRGPFVLTGQRITASADGKRHTLSIDVKEASQEAFAAALSNQVLSTSAIAGGKGDRVGKPQADTAFTVVIDPGHGGIDGGATGVHGAVEKTVTLAFARELKERIGKLDGVRAFLTRDDDRFIALDERVRIARQLGASLFISIHADTIRDKYLRGATVYTLSDKASDEVAHAVAQQENLSDAIGGVEAKIEDQEVADILIDLTRRETMQFSVKFARSLVEAIKLKAKTINNPQRSAGFRVLKAPDVPSVLVELGYLSNPDDEKLVTDPAWRGGVLDEMVKAIGEYAAQQALVSR